jgi:hypothetical protein
VSHGFLRAPDGTFTKFDPPGSVFTQPAGLCRTHDPKFLNECPAF